MPKHCWLLKLIELNDNHRIETREMIKIGYKQFKNKMALFYY